MKDASKTLQIDKIKLENGIQPRVRINNDVVQDYTSSLKEGVSFPPIELVFDGVDYYLWDGFHRLLSHKAAGKTEIRCIVTDGTRRDAILKASGANRGHGLRRSNADKRKSIESLLNDEEWSKWSDREIARQCEVSEHTVADCRKSLTAQTRSEKPRTYNTKHGTQAEMKTENIGKKAEPPKPEKPSKPETAKAVKKEKKKPPKAEEQKTTAPKIENEEPLGELSPVDQALANGRQWEIAKRHLQVQVFQMFEELSKLPGGVFLDDNKLQEVKGKIANLVEVLRDTKPYAECPYCKTGCKTCRNSGYVPQHIHRNAPTKGDGK